MHPNVERLLYAIVVVALLVSPASGGPLLGDPNAMLSGTEFFPGEFFAIKADVEYAVYAPGMFGTSAALGSPAAVDPSSGSDYVYAYEVFNRTNSAVVLNSLSIGLEAFAVSGDPADVTHAPSTPEGGLAPDLSQWIPVTGSPKANVKWSWTTTLITAGVNSDILLFVSPHTPDFFNASILGGIDFASGQLPSPTVAPEPSTLALAAMAVMGLLAAGYIRRRKV